MTPTPSAARWLLTGPDERWRLAPDVDMDALRTELSEAMTSGSLVTVEVMIDAAVAPLLVNARALHTVAVVESLDSRTGPSN